MIVGAGGGHDPGVDELMEFETGADAPPPPAIPPGHPRAPLGHPAHPHHPHHHAYAAWHDYHHGQQQPQVYGRQYHPRGVPWAYVRSPMGPVVHDEQPTHTREFPIGFSAIAPNNVLAGENVGIEQKPQVLFRGERLAIPASIVGDFDLTDIKVGKDSQLASPGLMPAEAFSNLSVGVRMQLDTAEPGITITLFVTNNAGQPQDFRAVLYGTVIE